MLKYFTPTWMVESIYSIKPEQLRKNNIQAVITDLDNTLIAWDNVEATQESIRWIDMMKEADIPVIILSNNTDERIKKVADILDLEYVPFSLKPSRRGFKKAQEKLDLPVDQIVMVGDQVITDVLGANRFGVRTILVRPLLQSDAWNTRFNRFLEMNIMKLLNKAQPDLKWRDSLDEPIN